MRNIKNYLLIISLTLTLISACTESVHQTEQSLDKEHLKKLEALVNSNQSTEFSLSVSRSEFVIIATGITTKVVTSSSNK